MSGRRRRRFGPGLSLSSLLSLTMAVTAASAAEPAFDPALAKAPPVARSATLELLAKPDAAGNAVLRVQLERRRSPSPLVIPGPAGPTLLRDDGIAPDDRAGDGQHAAIVQVDVEAFAREQRRLIALAREVTTVPQFVQRELRGFAPWRPPQFDRLLPGVPVVLDKVHGFPVKLNAGRTLMVRDPAVVDDPTRTYDPCSGSGTPMGAWTFGRLMTEIANEPATGIHPSDLVQQWIGQWLSDLTINGMVVNNRAIGAQAVLDAWPKLVDGRLDLAQAPFRLLAIVNRQDLRGSQAYGGSGDAGEARLVFGLLNCTQIPGGHFPPGQVQQMTVIFEYGIARSTCPSVKAWAQQWQALSALVLGSPAYNAALQAITDQFTLRDANPARLPNRSAINQVRTNEFALSTFVSDSFWELRESKLQTKGPNIGRLRHATVAQTPDRAFQHTVTLRGYISEFNAEILAGTHVVPFSYPLVGGAPFRAGHFEPGAGSAWTTNGAVDLEARHRFGLATCDGCHVGEGVADFVHIAPRASGAQSALSDFLTGANMPKADPVSGVNRHFNDLLERQMKLDATANMTCMKARDFPAEELFFTPLPPAFTH